MNLWEPFDAGSLPDDLRLPPDMVVAPLPAQIQAAREDLHRYIATHGPRIERPRGRGHVSPLVYAAGVQVRRSILYTLLTALAQHTNGNPPNEPPNH